MEGDSSGAGEHTIQYTDDVLWDCTPETDIILLINVTPSKFNKMEKNLSYGPFPEKG